MFMVASLVLLLSWADLSTIEDEYIVEHQIDDGEWKEALRAQRDETEASVSVDTPFKVIKFRVKASNLYGQSEPSNEVSVRRLKSGKVQIR